MDKGSALRILVADDHLILRESVCAFIESRSGCEIVGQAATASESVDLALETKPDVILMDILFRSGNTGIEATKQIVRQLPSVMVLMMSATSDPCCVRESFRAGASGYLLKDSLNGELPLALEAMRNGYFYTSPQITRDLVLGALANGGTPALTKRQREILQQLASGLSVKETAAGLKIAAKTVHAHRKEIMSRLGIHEPAGLIRYAMSTGLIPPQGYAGPR